METDKLWKSSVVIGISIVLSTSIFSSYMYHSRVEKDTISVIGSATRRHTADVVKWAVTLGCTTNMEQENVKAGYLQTQKDMNLILQLLKSKGIDEQSITVKPIETDTKADKEGQQIGYNFHQTLFVVSNDIPKIENIALNPNLILGKGIIIQGSSLEYFISKLPDVKHELIAEATQDAKIRAEEIAKNSGVKVDRLLNGRTGVFQINEPYSTEVSSGGVYNTSTREKDISITLNANFSIK